VLSLLAVLHECYCFNASLPTWSCATFHAPLLLPLPVLSLLCLLNFLPTSYQLTWSCATLDAPLLLPLPVLSLLPFQVLLALELLLPVGLPDELWLETAALLLGVKALTGLAVHLLS
jgi:hypothetical protein